MIRAMRARPKGKPNLSNLWVVDIFDVHNRVLFSGIRLPFLASGFLPKYTNQS
jgi:hypothetical protein